MKWGNIKNANLTCPCLFTGNLLKTNKDLECFYKHSDHFPLAMRALITRLGLGAVNCCLYSSGSMFRMNGITVSICTLPISPAKKSSSRISEADAVLLAQGDHRDGGTTADREVHRDHPLERALPWLEGFGRTSELVACAFNYIKDLVSVKRF